MSVLRPHIDSPAVGLWSLLLHAWHRGADACRARCEAIVDTMFGFELRREELDELTRDTKKH